jgi:hypothetical protein
MAKNDERLSHKNSVGDPDLCKVPVALSEPPGLPLAQVRLAAFNEPK